MGVTLAVLLPGTPAAGPGEGRIGPAAILCAPELEDRANVHRSSIWLSGRAWRSDGAVERVSQKDVELIFALDVPTSIRASGSRWRRFRPVGETAVHPFTGAPASAAGRSSIRDNGVGRN